MSDRLYPSTAGVSAAPGAVVTADQVRAEKFYAAAPVPASVAPAPTPKAPAAAPDPEQTIADRLYGDPAPAPERTDIPADIKAERAADPARRMYGDKAFEFELPDDGSIPDADIREWRQVAQDLGAESEDVITYRLLAQQEAPTVEQHGEWVKESTRMLADNGYTDADLDLARRFVARDPRLVEHLAGGLGSHPHVVERFIQLARRARGAGKNF